jgi:hypothetical protein
MREITGNADTEDYPEKYDIEEIRQSGFIAQEVVTRGRGKQVTILAESPLQRIHANSITLRLCTICSAHSEGSPGIIS